MGGGASCAAAPMEVDQLQHQHVPLAQYREALDEQERLLGEIAQLRSAVHEAQHALLQFQRVREGEIAQLNAAMNERVGQEKAKDREIAQLRREVRDAQSEAARLKKDLEEQRREHRSFMDKVRAFFSTQPRLTGSAPVLYTHSRQSGISKFQVCVEGGREGGA